MFRWFFLVSCLGLSSLVAADSSQRLDDVKSEIKALESTLSANKADKEALYQELKKQSRAISSSNAKLRELSQQLKENQQQLSKLKTQQAKQEVDQQQHTDALLQQLRRAYIHAQPNYLKVLLNQNSPSQLARTDRYFQYFHQSRQQQLEAIKHQLSSLTEQQKQLFAVQQKNTNLLEQQRIQLTALEQKNKQRKQTFSKLDALITTQGSRLTALQQEEQSLQALLTKLSNKQKAPVIDPSTTPPSDTQAFSKQKGRLAWPLKGKLLARYGSTRNLGKLTWKGIMIGSNVGNDVTASAAGKVVFADWLRGFGLLIIIDHGQKYMTLYGNNDSLLKQAGEFVSAGEVIAQSGSDGMHHYSGLYFEVRHKGNPTNPLKWLDKKG